MSENGRGRRGWLIWAFATIGIIALVAAAIVVSQQAALAAPPQPIEFSHRVHNEAGVQCMFCHPNPLRSDLAGIPSVERCIGCHQVIATDRPKVQVIFGYWDQGQPIPWERVSTMPDHVYFSHQPHLLAGLNCETCHGDVGQMVGAHLTVNMDMGWCLDCHLEQPEDQVARLADCLVCHK
jgi:hypothetical protein